MSVVHGHTLRRDHPHRERERMFNNMSRQDIGDYWLAEFAKLKNTDQV